MIAKRALSLALVAALAAGPLAGCLGLFGKDDDVGPADVDAGRKIIDNDTITDIEDRIAAIPKNYTFAGQLALPPTTLYVNGTVTPDANTGVEDKNNRAGNSYGGFREMKDVASLIPAGQPTELRLTLTFGNTPGNAADCDIVVDIPGTKTAFNTANSDQFNWKLPVQRMIVNAAGVPGATHAVGIECHNGQVTSGVPYTLRIDATYAKDAFAPGIAYAFNVPANATGVILSSEKAGGPEHLEAWFSIIGPNDDLVQFVQFNDIAIPTESVFIPTTEPGEYVFYAYNMTGGFLSLRADAPVEDRAVRVLALAETAVVDVTGPSPGVAPRDFLHDGTIPMTPMQGGQEVAIDAGATFPLRITPFIGQPGSGARTAMSHVEIHSAKGLVASLQRFMRMDDERGSLGVSQDAFNSEFIPANLARGGYTIKIVNDSPDAAVGHVLLTYVR